MIEISRRAAIVLAAAIFAVMLAAPAAAQSCYTAAEMDAATKAALQATAAQQFQLAQQGNTTAMQQNAEFNLADVVSVNKELFTGQASARNTYLLDNSSPGQGPAEFFCGIANSQNRVGFNLGNLPAGKYGVVIQDVSGGKSGRVSWILHQTGAQWKIAGLYPKPGEVAGHDGNWYWTQARAFKAKGQMHNAWLYYLVANDVLRPFPAMSTDGFDALTDEAQSAMPKDMPSRRQPQALLANGRTFNLTDMFAAPVGTNLDLIVKYDVPDISDSSKAFQDNMAVIKALVAKYPEFRDAFAAVVARAVAPNGQDYGTPLNVKDIK